MQLPRHGNQRVCLHLFALGGNTKTQTSSYHQLNGLEKLVFFSNRLTDGKSSNTNDIVPLQTASGIPHMNKQAYLSKHYVSLYNYFEIIFNWRNPPNDSLCLYEKPVNS